ncbi:hypothetical protein [Gordonia malaquae]|uniref:hypothetical protein n=1 Tax=Gordonia malaquae TaxID=410332 RepID=UPI0030FF1C11
MTQPTIDPTDLYFVTAGLDPSMPPQAIFAKLTGQLMALDAMVRHGQSVNPAYRARVALARDVIGFLGPKVQYDAARAAGQVPTDEELVAMTKASIPKAMRAGYRTTSWTSPSMLAGYAIFGVLILLMVVFGAASCGSDDGSPTATPGTASTAASDSAGETGTTEASPLDQLANGAEFEVVRTIDLKTLLPDADLSDKFWTDTILIHGPGDTIEIGMASNAGSYNKGYEWSATLSIDANGIAKVVKSGKAAVGAMDARKSAAEADGTLGTDIRSAEGPAKVIDAVALDDGRIFAAWVTDDTTENRGLLSEIKVKN